MPNSQGFYHYNIGMSEEAAWSAAKGTNAQDPHQQHTNAEHIV
jgi:hypothetical protein